MKVTNCAIMREERQWAPYLAISEAMNQSQITLTVENRDQKAEVTVSPSDTISSILSKAYCGEGLKAVHVGAPLGILLPAEKLDVALNALPGDLYSLSIKLLYSDVCIVDYMKKALADCEEGSCGRCVPCREGVRQMRTILDAATDGKARPNDIELLLDVADGISQSSHCVFGKGMGKLVVSALNGFMDEFNAHAVRKTCNALVCGKYVTYHILGACTGCGDCMDVCEEDAINGKNKFIHVINQNDCIRCGKCLETCPEQVIVRAGAVKPRTPPRPLPCGTWKLS